MRVTEALDAGAVCLQEAEPITADDDYGTLAARLERLGGDLLVRALDERPAFVEQDEAGVTYAHKLGAADRALDPRARAGRARAHRARAATAHRRAGRAARRGLPRRHRGPRGGGGPEPGRVRAKGDRLLLGTADGALELTEIRPPGGRPMAPASGSGAGQPRASRTSADGIRGPHPNFFFFPGP